MRRLTLSLLAGALILGVVAAPVSARRAGPSIVDTAVAANASGPLAGQFDTLISLVTTYGLAGTLAGAEAHGVEVGELHAEVDDAEQQHHEQREDDGELDERGAANSVNVPA